MTRRMPRTTTPKKAMSFTCPRWARLSKSTSRRFEKIGTDGRLAGPVAALTRQTYIHILHIVIGIDRR